MSKDKESICVTVRVRPLSSKELEQDTRVCLKADEFINMITMTGPNSERETKDFYFDSVCDAISQNEMFEKVGKRSTVFCMEGYNCTIFAYGQTGAGKTYTMMGVNPQSRDFFQQRGLVPRTLEHLFECIQKQISEERIDYIIKCSFVQIYNEQIIDLLGTGSASLNIREDLKKGVYIEGVSQQTISQSEEAMEILRKGSKGRHVGSTFYNETSSRSHSVFTMQIQSQQVSNGIKSTKSRHFHFIDLAGSERTKKSMGDRLKEGCSINKSLHVLSTVISSLAEVSEGKTRHVNYRDSKLTFLLKDSLGGNSKTHLIANISPSFMSALQTKSTLMFARKVKLIKVNKVSINEDASGNLQSLKAEIRRLRSENLQLLNGGVALPMTITNETTSNAGNFKMVSVLQQYVDEELQKQTQLQLQITKLTNKNNNLQKGIEHFCDNQKQLRMIISIYEDKVKKMKRAEETLIHQIGELSAKETTQQIKVYFQQEREALLYEIQKYKKLSSSTSLVKNLLKELKMLKQDSQNDNGEESLIAILSKNNEFLETIKNSISELELEPEVQQGKASKVVLKQNEDLKLRNEEMKQEIERYNFELTQAKEKTEECQALLSEAISTQIMLQKKMDEESKQFNEAMETKDLEIDHLHQMYCKNSAQLKKQKQKQKQLQPIISQYHTQISQLQNQLETIKNTKQTEISTLQQKLENLTNQSHEHQENTKRKVEEINKLKSEARITKCEWQKNKQEMQIVLEEASNRIADLEVRERELQNEKDITKSQLLNLQQQLQYKIDSCENEKASALSQLEISCKQMEALQQELDKQKQETASFQQKYNLLLISHASQQEKWQQNNSQLIKVINEKKTNDSQTDAKLTEAHLQNIQLNEKYLEASIQLKKITEDFKLLETTSETKRTDLEKQKCELSQLIVLRETEAAQNKNKIQILEESEQSLKRHNKSLEEQIMYGENEKQKNIQEIAKLKNKQKESKLALSELKNDFYALKKNSEVEIQCLEQQLKIKEDDISAAIRQNCDLKEANEKSLKEVQRKMQSEYETLKQNEESIKRVLEADLLNKQKRVSQLSTANKLLQQQLKQRTVKQEVLEGQITQVVQNLMVQKEARKKAEEQRNEQINIITKTQQSIEQIEYDHLKAVEEMENNFNQQVDTKNAQIQQLRKTVQNQQSSLQSLTEIKQSHQKINQQAVTLKQELQSSIKDRSNLEIELKKTKSNIEARQKILANLQKQLNQKQSLFEKIRQTQTVSQQNLIKQIHSKQQTINKLNNVLSTNQFEIQTLTNTLQKIKNQKCQSSSSIQNQEVKCLEQKNEELCNKLHIVQRNYCEISNKYGEMELSYNNLANKVCADMAMENENTRLNVDIQRMQKQMNDIKGKFEDFKMESNQQKELNKQFKMLLDNAHCQIDSFKSELQEKDKLYHQLLDKVSKNDTERKGMINQDKKFSDLLEKSRIQVSELRKKYEDQLKLNSTLKQEIDKKEVDCSVVKDRSQQYCRKQQQFMESIKVDYTKIENQLKNTKQALEQKTKSLNKITFKNEELQEKVSILNRQCLEAQMSNEQLKKQGLRMEIDERKTSYVNRIKQENTQLKKELEKTCEQVILLNQEKLQYKSEGRIGKESDLSSVELNKKVSEVKYLQKIIDELVNVLGIKDYKKSIGECLKLSILELQKELSKSRSQLAQLNDEVHFKNQRLLILESQKSKMLGRDDDNTLLKMRKKIERTSKNFESIRQSKEEDKLILQSKDPNKGNLWE